MSTLDSALLKQIWKFAFFPPEKYNAEKLSYAMWQMRLHGEIWPTQFSAPTTRSSNSNSSAFGADSLKVEAVSSHFQLD